MAYINLEVSSGETKTIRFQSANTYTPEDIVFNVIGIGGGSGSTLSGVTYSNTAAATVEKTATIPEFSLSNGQSILLHLQTSSTVANATLNISSTGAKTVRIGGSSTTSSNFTSGYWLCTYDGTYWNATKIDYSSSTHTHGNITSGGSLQTTDITIANGDKLVVTDSSDSGKVARTSISFDGSTTSQVLSKKGTWINLPTNTDVNVQQETDNTDTYRPILLSKDNGNISHTPSSSITDISYMSRGVFVNPNKSLIVAGGFVYGDGSSNGFLTGNGSIDNNSYSLSNHNHNSTYKTIQTAVSDPTTSGTSTSFINTISQNTNGDISVTKSSLPSASSSTAGITKVGASDEGAASYNHTHTLSIVSGGNNPTSLSANTTYTLTAGGSTLVFKTPSGGSGGGGSTVSANNITLSTSPQTYITVDGTTNTIKLPSTNPWGGNVTSMAAYSFIGGGVVTPLEYVTNLLSNVINESVSNDIHTFSMNVPIREYNGSGGIDGHIPVGAVILFYAGYLLKRGNTYGRLIVENSGYGDYFGYIICDNDVMSYANSSYTDPQLGSSDLLTANNITLVTSNWSSYNNLNHLPNGINDYTQETAVNSGGSIIGGSANGDIHHRYIFTFMDIVQGDDFSELGNIIDALPEDPSKAVDDFLTTFQYNKGDNGKTPEFFKRMVVTCEHRSVAHMDVGYGIFS